MGRFLNGDEPALIGASGTLLSNNLYSYCDNNPVMNRDFSGYWYINIKITDRLVYIVDLILLCLSIVIAGIIVAKAGKVAAKVISWFSKKSFKKKLTKICTVLAKAIFGFLEGIIYNIADAVPKAFRTISITLIADKLMDLIDLSPARIILNLIDSIDGDKKSGYIRW